MRFSALFSALCLTVLAALVLCGSALGSSEFYIRGGGYGHGIGMSQYGAYGYAQHGKDYRFILSHYYQGTAIGTTDPSQMVRVLLGTGSSAFAGAARVGARKLNPSLTYQVRALGDGSLVLTKPSGKKVGRFTAPLVATGPGPLSVAGLGSYRGSLEFRPDGHGGVETIDALGLEDYVRGVISAEVPSTWSPEALKAQAVAARTYALTTDAGGGDFGLYSDTRSQMYRGVSAETPSTDAAVAATRDQIVTYHGAPVVTYFFSSSGGHTENVENVWPGATPEPWLRGVPDPYDNAGGNPYHRWSLQLPAAAAAAKLGRLVKGRLLGIQAVEYGASPRILLADVVGTGGRIRVTGIQLQRVFQLLTTDSAFTTITTAPGQPAAVSPSHTAQTAAQAVAALIPLVHNLVAGTLPGLHGSVFPGHRGESVTVQQLGASGWRDVAKTALRAGGSYQAQLPSRGTYRIVYRGIDGPAVSVS
jgi:stage II sporulation protein D